MVCTNCKQLRHKRKQGIKVKSSYLICLYHVSAALPADFKQNSPAKGGQMDANTLAAWRQQLRSMWKPLPVKRRKPKKTSTRLLDDRHLLHEEDRPTSPKGARIAYEERSARLIQERYRSHLRREKFRAWVNLAMNTDKGRNRCARKIQSIWRMASCKLLYRRKQKAAKVLQNFLRLIHGRRLAMRRALRVLYQTLHRMAPCGKISGLYNAVATTKKSRDMKRVQRAVEYLASEGHGHVDFSVLGALRLNHQLQKTELRLQKRREAKLTRWAKKQRPASWNDVLKSPQSENNRPLSPMSKWFAAQRDRRDRLLAQDALSLHARHRQIIERRLKRASVVRAQSPSRFDGRERDKTRLSENYMRSYAF